MEDRLKNQLFAGALGVLNAYASAGAKAQINDEQVATTYQMDQIKHQLSRLDQSTANLYNNFKYSFFFVSFI